jgi:hypothetical protein
MRSRLLLSTIDRNGQRGQILILFAGGLVTLMLVAALAFDVGLMLVERRDQQNAADAAALHGARYLPISATTAASAALALAADNDFNNSDPNEVVTVHIPPVHGDHAGFPGFIEVQIQTTRPSIFGGVLGRAGWDVGVYAVAANQQGATFPFGMLALSRTACKAIQISGTGNLISEANVHSNSTGADCPEGEGGIGFSRTGGSTVDIRGDGVCRSAGLIQDQGSGSMTCTLDPNQFALPDPLLGLQAPQKPALAPAMRPYGFTLTDAPIPNHCPGAGIPPSTATAPTEDNPQVCALGNGNIQKNRKWILSPGLYPGGINVQGDVTLYLQPGIYWIGGGGWRMASGSSIVSVQANAGSVEGGPPSFGGGVMIYNSKLPAAAGGAIQMGGGSAELKLLPHPYPFGNETIHIAIFQDRTVCEQVTLNGGDSDVIVRGIIYVPCGAPPPGVAVQINGSDSSMELDQIVAETYKINGSGGTITVTRESGIDAKVAAVGLVD